MNLYIVVEGEETEMQLYPKWISYSIPELQKVDTYKQVVKNSYYLFCGQGIPSIYKHTANAIKDINQFGKYDYLIVCLDCDNLNPEARKKKLTDYLITEGVELNNLCKLEIVVQNACVESWFLGNRKAFKRNPEGLKFKEFVNFFDVSVNDPEAMEKYEGYTQKSHFHEAYLREMLKEHGQRYRKSNPKVVLNEPYYQELQKRVNEESKQMSTLRSFFTLCKEVKAKIITT
jgi:hypothetical protein